MRFKKNIKNLFTKLYLVLTPVLVYVFLPSIIKSLNLPNYIIPSNVVVVAIIVLIISLILYIPLFYTKRELIKPYTILITQGFIDLFFEKKEDSTKNKAL